MLATTLESLIDGIERDEKLGPQLVHRAWLPGQPSSFATLEPPVPPRLVEALGTAGITELFSHQVEGLDAARRGEDVLVTTPTASGKSLIFQLPILERALAGEPGRALFLFPLKALGQDQYQKLNSLAQSVSLGGEDGGIEFCEIYDGDTPRKKREQIRAHPPRVLISNPDMLHLGILGNSGAWGEFLSELRFIVLDELHTYRGVFGTHFHHVLQRLLRLARRHGAEPQIIASSATAENARDFAKELTGRSFTRIEQSGAATEGKHFLLLQPETSPYTTTLHLFASLLEAGLKTIVFTKARRITELLHSWLEQRYPQLEKRVTNYRAGFLASERRDIENQLFTGHLDGVISTSALEMGIDIGGLDACILVGYPGSMMATWQRSGRVGREGRESITALVAMPDALDQYLIQRPNEFLNRSCEPLIVRPAIESIARDHLLCAASEMPLERTTDTDYLATHAASVGDLLREFQLAEEHDGAIHCLAKAPHRRVGLRGGGAGFKIESVVTGRPVGTADGARVMRECHPGAIYLHAGRQYLVVELDRQQKLVRVEPVHVDYFTTPLTEKHTQILEVLAERSPAASQEGHAPLHSWLGRVRVIERVIGFERKKILGQERLGEEALDLPPTIFETTALWFAAPRDIEETLREHHEDFMGALHAAEHAAISLFPVLALCDRGDLGGVSIPYHPQVRSGAVFIYDGHAGGAGIAESGFARLPELLARVGQLLDACDCEEGCPGCVHSPKCGNGNRPLDKPGASRLIRLLLGKEAVAQVPGTSGHPGMLLDAPGIDELAIEDDPDQQVFRWLTPSEAGNAEGRAANRQAPDRSQRRPDLFDLEEENVARSNPAAPTDHQPTTTEPPPEPRVRPEPRSRQVPRRRGRRLDVPRPSLPRFIDRTVLFDVETKRSAEEVGGWHNLHRLGVALAVTCHMEENRFQVFREGDVPGLIDVLRSADMVVGFNVLGFDYPVLSGYIGEDLRRTLPTLDLLEQIERVVGKRLGLSHLAEATLGSSKSADGLQSLAWYREGRFDLIESYCRHDVEILRDLYLFGRREGWVGCKRDEKVLRVPVDWR